MRWQWFTLCLAVGIIFGAMRPAFAGAKENLPAPLIEAAAAYKAKGAEEFLPTLIKGSRLQYTDKASFTDANTMLKQIELHYGSYLGIELVGAIAISDSTRLVYFVIKYERGPLYGVADIYKTRHGEVVTNSNVNTELNQIMPPEIIARLR